MGSKLQSKLNLDLYMNFEFPAYFKQRFLVKNVTSTLVLETFCLQKVEE